MLNFMSVVYMTTRQAQKRSKDVIQRTEHHETSRFMTKPTNWHVRPAKTQISLGISGCPGLSESSPGAHAILLVLSWGGSCKRENNEKLLRFATPPLVPNEPRHDKTNKVIVRPAKIQISLGIRPVWSESSLSAWRKLGSLTTHSAEAKTLIRLGGCPGWSESSLGAQSLRWFCHVAARM